ncbi:glycosyltransferase family protein [Jatrophihabitans fulvus]
MSNLVHVSPATDDTTLPSRPITVASVPSDHVYVAHLSDPGADDGVVRLPDPPPLDPTSTGWWPPRMLDPQWLRAHAGTFDLLHLHFGFDALSVEELVRVVDTLDELNTPLVYTAHDLRNPHHHDRSTHDAHLDVLVPRAAAVITLTAGAANDIRRRWGRRATVLPHPHVVPLPVLGRVRHERDGFRVGVHLKSLRPNADPRGVVAALLPLTDELPGLELRFDLHTEVVDPAHPRHDAELVRMLTRARDDGRVDLAVHDMFTDDELWCYLAGLDLSVLPYRFGTHSGWLEACHDLGTAVAAPVCGFYAEQRPCLPFASADDGIDAESLRDAVRTAYLARPSWQATPAGRWTERVAVAAAHRRVYTEVLA